MKQNAPVPALRHGAADEWRCRTLSRPQARAVDVPERWSRRWEQARLYDGPAELPRIRATSTDPLQVVVNLVRNAPAGARRASRARRGRSRRSRVVGNVPADRGEGQRARYPVRGAREARDPFFTTRDAGTGLGIAQCKRLVGRLGGDPRIESATGSARSSSRCPSSSRTYRHNRKVNVGRPTLSHPVWVSASLSRDTTREVWYSDDPLEKPMRTTVLSVEGQRRRRDASSRVLTKFARIEFVVERVVIIGRGARTSGIDHLRRGRRRSRPSR